MTFPSIQEELTYFKNRCRQAEQALLLMEERSKLFMQLLPGIRFVFQKQRERFIFTYLDGAPLYHVNFFPDHFIGKDIMRFFPVQAVQDIMPHFEEAWNGKNVTFFYDLYLGIQFQIDLRPLLFENNVVEVIGTCTESKTEETGAMVDVLTQLTPLFMYSDNAIILMDANCRVLKVNRVFEQMFGWSYPEVVGQTLPTFPADLWAGFHESVEKISLSDDATLSYETSAVRKNGQLLPVSITLSSICNFHQSIVAYACVIQDLSERIRAEQERHITFAYLESFFDNTTDAIGVFALDGTILKVNKAAEEMFGYSCDEMLGQPVRTIPDDSYKEEVRHLQETARRGHSVNGFETIRKRKDGKLIDVSITYSPIKDSEGNVIAFANIVRDITERKRREELLLHKEKLSVIGELAAGIAHEIRNPLTSLRGFIQFLQPVLAGHKPFADIMLTELDRINYIVSELLVLAKPQALNVKQRNITDILERVLTLLQTQANMNNIEIHTCLQANLPPMVCEETQIKQVFINIVKNAFEAMPDGGTVWIKTVWEDHQHVKVIIQDNGCGISDDRLSKLGQPFYTTKEKGTGLGLTVSQKIIRDHQGKLSISSEVNKGTMVEIILPLSPFHDGNP